MLLIDTLEHANYRLKYAYSSQLRQLGCVSRLMLTLCNVLNISGQGKVVDLSMWHIEEIMMEDYDIES